MGELKRVLNQVGQCRQKNLWVGVNHQHFGDGCDCQLQPAVRSVDRSGDRDVLDERSHRQVRPLVDTSLQTNLCKRAIEEITHSGKTASYDNASASARPDSSRLQSAE